MALAGDAHMSTSYLADIEHDRTVPTLGRLQAVAIALEVTVRDLLQGVEPYDATSGLTPANPPKPTAQSDPAAGE